MAEGRDDAERYSTVSSPDIKSTMTWIKRIDATDCPAKDRDALPAFYDFPVDHWKPIRIGEPIERTFATVHHRAVRAKGCLSDGTAQTILFKKIQAGQKS